MSWSTHECLAALRAAASGRTSRWLGRAEYRAWRAAQITEWPPEEAIAERLGPWPQPVRLAGAAADRPPPDAGRGGGPVGTDLVDLRDVGEAAVPPSSPGRAGAHDQGRGAQPGGGAPGDLRRVVRAG